jgi:hypothetical protein
VRADEVAREIDTAARALLDTILRRSAIESEVIGIVHVARMGGETLVRRSRTDALRAAAERLLAKGEAPPRYEPMRPVVAIGGEAP